MYFQNTGPLLVCVSFCCVVVHAVKSESARKCTFNGKQYKVGQVWHPGVYPYSVSRCVNCTCLQTGRVICEGQRCPSVKPTCKRLIRRNKECCPICKEDDPTTKSRPEATTGTTRPGCQHGGTKYRHLQVFPSRATSLEPKSDQCVLCTCLDGKVLCHLRTCLNLTCKNQIIEADNCCPTCSDEHDGKTEWVDHSPHDVIKGNNEAVPPSSSPEVDPKACISNNRVFKHNKTWHPSISPFGRMYCIICTCKNAKIRCNRLKCPAASELPCRRPQRQQGQCCRVCTSDKTTTLAVGTALPKNTGQLPGGHDKLKTCPRGKRDTIVLRSRAKTQFSLLFENVKTKKIMWYKWVLSKGKILRFSTSVLTAKQYRDLFRDDTQTFSIIGATHSRRVSKLKNKVQNVLRRCKLRCSRKLLDKFTKRLKLRKIEYKQKC